MARAVRLASGIKELRIHLCQKAEHSKGVREFIEKYYVPLKKENPKFPILIRECSGVEPRMWARYEFGREASVPLSNMKSDEVLRQIERLTS